ncbi:MAG: DUF4136 domain-containing protein [Croceibacterium sp.]
MKQLILASLAAALLAGCTTTYVSPVEVTRFVGAAPSQLGSGQLAVQPAPGQEPASWGYAALHAAVSEKLQRLGYNLTGDMAQQVAELSVTQATDRPGRGRSPVSVGVGGSTGGYGSGVGAGIGIDLSPRPGPVTDTELRVVIRPSGGGAALWEGRARFAASANSRYSDPRAAAARLAEALFSGFPGRSGETIEVR